MFVQFTDSTETKIQSVFSCAQDATAYPNQANIDATDARYLAFINPPATVAQQAQAALNAGVVLASTSTPDLDGTYPIAGNTKTDLTGLIVYIGLKQAFPGVASTMNWYDATGTAHAFNITQFEAFAEGVCAFIQAVEEWQLAGGVGAVPSNTVVIA